MSGAVFRAMLLGFLRDRGALVMSLVLPGLVFLIFAAMFAGASGEALRLEVAISDVVRSETSTRLIEALARDPSLARVGGHDLGPEQVEEWVRRGSADVGLIVRAGGASLDSLGGFGPAPLLIVTDPVRGVAGPMLAGQIQKAYFDALPDVALGGVVQLIEDGFVELSEIQHARVAEGLDDLRVEAEEAAARGASAGWGFEDLFELQPVAGRSAASNHVAYYAGAVAVLFLLFSAVHGAITLLEERDSGVLDRILAGPGSTRALVDGKLAFLVLQGFVQIGVVFLLAWLVYDVDLAGHVGPWAVTTLIASAAAAALGLAVVAACRTRRQAQTVANTAILILSALGGSMVPRFFMPPLLQDLGWITPNTWALEAYTSIFWRGDPVAELVAPWSVLAGAALVGWLVARRLARRMETL